MYARLVKIKGNKVLIDGEEYTLDEIQKLDIFGGFGKDEKGELYVIIKGGA